MSNVCVYQGINHGLIIYKKIAYIEGGGPPTYSLVSICLQLL
jgi:hypothetical protein